MNLDPDITPDELKVFLEEAEEQLELLDEDIVKLEKEGDDPELIQEIFRAAHTLKGSSAMIGHQTMAELTHNMESLLDKVRNGDIAVSTVVIDALLSGLDVIKVLKEQITDPDAEDIDIQPSIAMLREALGVEETKKETAKEITLAPDRAALDSIQTALAGGQNIFHLDIYINEESEWAAIRCLQCLNETGRIGEIICSSPTAEEIDEEKVGYNIKLILATTEDSDTVAGTVSTITDIVRTEITEYDPEQGASGGREEESAAPEPEAQESNTPAKSRTSQQESSQNLQSVRVDVRVLDNLMNIVEELVIDRSNISQVGKLLAEKYSGDELVQQLSQTSDHIIKVINDLQERIMQVRMVPIGAIFSRFPRMVRDLAQTQKKKIDFQVFGEETELDRSLIEQVRDPLIHLLRNAVDHGIESPEKREEAGKPETSVITLSAEREQSHIVITVEDDGGGILADNVRASAVKKGFISQEKADGLSDSDAINLIFMAGMSTAKKATEVSGRGVGLDIVRANIENLGGSILLETKPGKGTRFTIKLPLTVAIVQGLLVSAGGTIYVLPLTSVVETVAVAPSDVHTIRGKEIIRRMDSLVPLVRLNKTFDSDSFELDKTTDRGIVVVAKADESLIGLMVDMLLEPQEIVVKSLGKYMGDVEGIAGATILGDGRVALILDVASLVRIVARQGEEQSGNEQLLSRLAGTGV